MKELTGKLLIVAMLGLVMVGCESGEAVADSEQMNDGATFVDTFDPGWEETQKDWRVATWKQNGAQMSPDRCKTNGKGQLVQTVTAGEPYQGGSMQTNKEFGYGKWVARLKPSAVPGVLNSMFTMDWADLNNPDTKNSDGTKFEVDIEFLTYTFGEGHGEVHLAVHLPPKKNLFVKEQKLDFNPSDDYHEWGFEILPDVIIWSVDGKELARFERPEGEVFNENYEFFFNSWTRDRWINGPAEEDAHYHIDWVKFYPAK